jgi:hypothetical protein
MDDSERNRILRIEIPPCTVAGDGLNWTDLTGLNGWAPVPTFPTALYWSGSIDLSGYARDYKTFYPSGGVIQEGPFWSAPDGSGQTVFTVVSSIPLNPDVMILQMSGNGGPGFIDANFLATGAGQQDWTTVLFAESQINLINSNLPTLGICQPITIKQFGSLQPTAAQVLYVMKLVLPSNINDLIGTSLAIPASRVILPGTMDQEPELEYMMRLSRSVELANQV